MSSHLQVHGLRTAPSLSCSSLESAACVTEQEDVLLRRLIKEHGVKKWSSVAEGIPGRSGKSCRLRYVHRSVAHRMRSVSMQRCITFLQVVQPAVPPFEEKVF